jgi:hypothetical protein
VEGAKYRLEKNDMIDWPKTWGEPLCNLKEDVHENTIDLDTDTEPLGTGVHSLKMKLKESPPHVPMCGRRMGL